MRTALVSAVTACVTVFTASAVLAKPAVQNGDFERGGGTDFAGWSATGSDAAVWRIEPGVGLNGNRGLVWRSEKVVSSNSFGQDVAFRPGCRYIVEGYVKTDLKKPASGPNGAGVCLQWFDKDGQLLGQCYPRKVRGKSEWTRVEGVTSVPIPAETVRLRVAPFVVKGGTGVAAFDEIAVREHVQRTLGSLQSSAYRDIAASGRVKFFAPFFPPSGAFDPAKYAATFEYESAAGGRKLVPVAAVERDFVSIEVPVRDIAFGTHEVVCSVTSCDGSVRGEARMDFARVESLPERRVHVDARNRLVVDGKPFFPLGFCSQGYNVTDDANMRRLKESPCNTILFMNVRLSRKQLDIFDAAGVKVIYSLKDAFAGSRRAPKEMKCEADEIPWLEKFMADFADHKAIIAWDVTDEPAVSEVERLTNRRKWLAARDPSRPTMGIFNHVGKLREFLPVADVFSTDIYPVSIKPIRAAADDTATTVSSTFGSKAVVQTMQLFGWGDLKNLSLGQKGGRFPTRAELRAMAWQMIASGANGLLGFAFNMMVDLKTSKPIGDRWSDCCEVYSEVSCFIPVILADGVPPPVREQSKTLAVRTFRRDGEVWILVCNLEENGNKATFRVDGVEGTATCVLGGGVSGRNGVFSADMPPLGVAIVRVDARKSGGNAAEKTPVLLSNGRISVLIDDNLSVPEFLRYGNESHTNAILWSGRRMSGSGYGLYSHGRFVPAVKIGGARLGEPAKRTQTFNPREAETSVLLEYADGTKVSGSAFVSANENAIAVRIKASSHSSADVEADLEYMAPQTNREVVVCDGEGGKSLRMTTFGRRTNDTAVEISRVDIGLGEAAFFICFADSQERAEGSPADRAAALAADMARRGWEVVRKAHVKAWAAYFGESRVEVPDERLMRLREMAEYQLKCNVTENSIPVGLVPGSWQGKVFAFDEMYAVQALLSSGHFGDARAATDFRRRTLVEAHSRNGSWGMHNYRDGHSFGSRWVWVSMEDSVTEGSRQGFWHDHIFHMAAIARSAYLQWRFSRDDAYLRNSSYPVIMECARYFRWHSLYDDGKGGVYVGKCTDLERLGPARERACMTTVGVIHTFRAAAETAKHLGVDVAESDELLRLAVLLEKSLPIEDGRFVAYPGCPEDSMGTLAGYFPFPVFPRGHATMCRTVEHFLEKGAAVGNMYAMGKRICPWYAATMAVAADMAGCGSPYRWIEEAFASAGTWGEYWEINEPAVQKRPWFMTAAANTLYAINRLFVADQGDETRIAFGTPAEWKDFSFALPSECGAFVRCKVAGGKISEISLSPSNRGNGIAALRFRTSMLGADSLALLNVLSRVDSGEDVLVKCAYSSR